MGAVVGWWWAVKVGQSEDRGVDGGVGGEGL